MARSNLITVTNTKKKSLLEKYEISLDNLSYEYIEGCTNSTRLEYIITILRSGEEGIYPDLTRHAEERLRIIKPDSLILQKTLPICTTKMLQKNKRKEIEDHINNWITKMHILEKDLNNCKSTPLQDYSYLPDVRHVEHILDKDTNKINNTVNKSKRLCVCDYVAWDKYDVEIEMNRIDLEDEIKKNKAKEMQRKQNKKEQKMNEPSKLIKDLVENEFTDTEINNIVEQERIKGKEYLQIGDYDNALKYFNFCYETNLCLLALADRATTYIKLNRYEDAIKDLNTVISEDSRNNDAILQRGYCFEKLEMLDEAIADYNILKDIPNYERVQALINKLEYSAMSKKLEMEEKKKTSQDNEEQKIIKPLEVNENDESKDTDLDPIVRQTKSVGKEYYKIGDYKNALKCYNFCYERNPCLDVLNKRAMTYIKLHRYEDAIEDLNIVISKGNTDYKKYYRRALSFANLGMLEEALDDFKKVSELNPIYEGIEDRIKKLKNLVVSNKIKIQTNEKTLPNTHETCNTDTKSNSISFCDYVNWNIYDLEVEDLKKDKDIQLGQNGMGLQEIKKTMELIDNLEKKTNLIIKQARLKGNEYYKNGDFQNALKFYNLCYKKHYCLVALKNRAVTNMKLLCYENAIADLNILILVNNQNSKAYYQRALCFAHLGILDEIIANFERVMEIQPNFPGVMDKMKKSTKSVVSNKINNENINSKNKIYNVTICLCEKGPGPSYINGSVPHIRDNCCVGNESKKILTSSSKIHHKLNNINLPFSNNIKPSKSAIYITKELKNNNQNKQKSIFSLNTINTTGVVIEEIDESDTTEPNYTVNLNNKKNK